MPNPAPFTILTLYIAAAALGGVAGRAAVMIAGLEWNGPAAWIATLLGMVVGGLAAARWIASRVDDAADAAAYLARAQPPAAPDAPRVLEFARMHAELAAASAARRADAAAIDELRREQDALLDAVDGAVIALDKEQRIINLNRAAEKMLSAASRDTALTPSSPSPVPPPSIPNEPGPLHPTKPAPRQARGLLLQEVVRYDALNRFVADAVNSTAPLTEEFQLARPIEGGRIGLSVRASSRPMLDPDGRVAAVLLFLTDVTRLRRLEAVRTDFAANVSHELRTPITNIRGYIDTLVESPLTDPDSTREFLKVAQRNASRLSEIVDDMLALTNLERPDTAESIVKSPTPVAAVIAPVLEALERARADRNIEIAVEGDTSLPALVSPRLIEQALENLVSNAIRYSPPGKRVIIRVALSSIPSESSAPRPAVEIAVIDEGPGIPSEHLPRVFERFYRVDKARGRDQGGTGLGLSIVKHIALAHQGKVTVESTPNHGSTFRLVLPKA